MTMAVLTRSGQSVGVLRMNGRDLRCALGQSGISARKREGDGATPSGHLPVRRVLYRADRLHSPVCGSLPREPIAPDDGWCDDPGHRDYNRAVSLPHAARCERLWREDGLYDLLAVLGYNDDPVERDRGSAIFLHVAAPDARPTQGCLALDRADLIWALQAGLTELEIPA